MTKAENHKRLPTLYSLSLVSKMIRNTVQPLLYKEFAVGYGLPRVMGPKSQLRRLESFINTIAIRRDLAAAVKRAYIGIHLDFPV